MTLDAENPLTGYLINQLIQSSARDTSFPLFNYCHQNRPKFYTAIVKQWLLRYVRLPAGKITLIIKQGRE